MYKRFVEPQPVLPWIIHAPRVDQRRDTGVIEEILGQESIIQTGDQE